MASFTLMPLAHAAELDARDAVRIASAACGVTAGITEVRATDNGWRVTVYPDGKDPGDLGQPSHRYRVSATGKARKLTLK